MGKIDWQQRYQQLALVYGPDARHWMYTGFDDDFVKAFRARYWQGHYPDDWEFTAVFALRNPLNFPGPFYTADTDTCGTGQPLAPHHILMDERYQEVVFRQPRTLTEFTDVFSAACIDPFAGYGFDGSQHWTLDLIKEWWSGKNRLIAKLQSPLVTRNNDGQNFRYIDYLNGEAEMDLRRYAYFLTYGAYPFDTTLVLPEIE